MSRHLTLEQLAKNINDDKRTRWTFSLCTRDAQAPLKNVDSKQKFDAQLQNMQEKIESIIETLKKETKRELREIVVGKTNTKGLKIRGKQVYRDVDANDHTTMTVEGLTSRYDKTYAERGFHCLVAFYCICKQDVPQGLSLFKVDHELFALMIEAALTERFTENGNAFHHLIKNKDKGGGGKRTEKTKNGYLLYVAIKFEDENDEVASEESVSE